MPTTEIDREQLRGIAATRPRPIVWAKLERRSARCRPTSSIFTITPTTPYTAIVMTMATTTRIASRLRNGSSATSLSAITMISADRMKSVRIAPDTIAFSASSPVPARGTAWCVVPADPAPDLLRTLVAEVAAADHQDRGEQPRQELAEQQRRREDEQQLVADRADRDPLDHRQLAVRGDAVDVLRRHRGVVDDDAGGLRRWPGRRRHRRRRPRRPPAVRARQRRRAVRTALQPCPRG